MNIVIVGGPHSGVGKTLAAEVALRTLAGAGYGAIKLTVADGERDPLHDHGRSAHTLAVAAGICGRGATCGVCETVSTKLPSRLVTSEGAIHKTGTDTWRLSEAGAVAVAWVIALREAAPASIDSALAYLASRGASGAVIEGTTALDWMTPDASVMVATDPGRKWKDVAVRKVLSCDIVLQNLVPEPPGDIAPPSEFDRATRIICDLNVAEHPGTQEYARTLLRLCSAKAAYR